MNVYSPPCWRPVLPKAMLEKALSELSPQGFGGEDPELDMAIGLSLLGAEAEPVASPVPTLPAEDVASPVPTLSAEDVEAAEPDVEAPPYEHPCYTPTSTHSSEDDKMVEAEDKASQPAQPSVSQDNTDGGGC